ncbi:WXG100 family type VII secretion target [Streptomyces sp. NPDC088354]|uniref:WXG100 family type VII secretion target n=1 Tax=Streptomyces sp. NPDC088354 TaxID=3365856 RepID=UPI00380B57A8
MNVNEAIAKWLVSIFDELGNPEPLYGHADAYISHADELASLHAAMSADGRLPSWEGAAKDEYEKARQQQLYAIEEAAKQYRSVGEATQQHASKSDKIAIEIVGIALEIIELLAVGAILTRLFAGIADFLWIRVFGLVKRILTLLSRFRAALTEFSQFLSRVGGRIGELLGQNLEKLLVAYLPEYSRSFLGFYIASAVPQLLSGRSVNWKDNAWQTAVFFAFDIGLNLVDDVIEATKFGIRFKNYITGKNNSGEIKAIEPNSLKFDDGSASHIRPAEGVPTKGPTAETKPAPGDGPSVPTKPTTADILGAGPRSARYLPESVVSKFSKFEPKSARDSLYSGIKEGINTCLANGMTDGVVQHVTGKSISADGFAIDTLLSGLMAGARTHIYGWSSAGEKFAYKNSPEGSPGTLRWLAETPNSWAYFSAYMTLKEAIKNGMLGNFTPTEIDSG